MSVNVSGTPKSGRHSLFFQDLASPVTARKSGGKFSTPNQAAAASALGRENFATSDLPPPPVFTLEDRYDLSPESGMLDYPLSPEAKLDSRTPLRSLTRELSTPKSKSEVGRSKQPSQLQSPMVSLNWWSPPAKSGGGTTEHEDKGSGSPVEGVVRPDALVTLPPPREVARPEVRRSLVPVGNLDGEEWVTVYGFLPGDTNLVLREFEKCGVILTHVPGPRDANWMHILYQNRSDAVKALGKNGVEINGVLIVGVRPVDPRQRQVLKEEEERRHRFNFVPNFESNGFKVNINPPNPHYYLQNSRNVGARQPVATPAKSMVSKIVDLMFGV